MSIPYSDSNHEERVKNLVAKHIGGVTSSEFIKFAKAAAQAINRVATDVECSFCGKVSTCLPCENCGFRGPIISASGGLRITYSADVTTRRRVLNWARRAVGKRERYPITVEIETGGYVPAGMIHHFRSTGA